jgi:hypothetical protein
MSGVAGGQGILELFHGIQAHASELQVIGLGATFVVLLLALVLLHRVASELDRSRSQRLMSAKTFEQVATILSALESGDTPLGDVRGSRRVSMSGPAQRTTRPIPTKPEVKAAGRSETRPAPAGAPARLGVRARSLH